MFNENPPHVLPPNGTAFDNNYVNYDDFARKFARHHVISLIHDPATTSAGPLSDNYRCVSELFVNLRKRTGHVNDFVESSLGGDTIGASPEGGVAEASPPPTAPPPPSSSSRVSARTTH